MKNQPRPTSSILLVTVAAAAALLLPRGATEKVPSRDASTERQELLGDVLISRVTVGRPTGNTPRPASATRTGAIVAVLDSGIDTDHEWLRDRTLPGISFIEEEPTIEDLNGHGTHVAGILALGAPDAVILPVKVLDGRGRGSDYSVAEGVNWALENGARVINLSLGAPSPLGWYLSEALAEAERRGVVVVASAGNDGPQSAPHYPAATETVLAVTSVNQEWQETDFDQAGEYIDISASGTNVYSSYPDGYGTLSGTSMSAPSVSAAAATLIAANPTWTAAEVRNHLLATAEDIGEPGRDTIFGWGRLDQNRAVSTPGPAIPENAHRSNVYTPQSGTRWVTLRPIHVGTRWLEVEALQPDGIIRMVVRSKKWALLHDNPGKYRVRAYNKNGEILGSSILTLEEPGRTAPVRLKTSKKRGGWVAVNGASKGRIIAIVALEANGEVSYSVAEIRANGQWTAVPVERHQRYRACYVGMNEQLHGCSQPARSS